MLGILCGLESERKIAAGIDGAQVTCSAARPHKARELAQELVRAGATRLMSFGIAGSLDTSVRLGDLVIGTRVVADNGLWACDEAWGKGLASKIPHARLGGVYGSEVLVTTTHAKESLHQKTGCAIVDMESQCLAEVAAAAQLPMIVVRSVCDDASMNVPPFVMAAIGEDGSTSVLRALGHLALHPLQTRDLFDVMRGTAGALRALKQVRDVLGAAAS